MNTAEQTAFVEAYSRNVGTVKPREVLDFVRRYAAGEDMDYTHNYTSIMDALMMWHSACRWQIIQNTPR